MNSIPELQNAPEQQQILAARSEIYERANLIVTAQLVLTVGLPVIAALAALLWPGLRPHTAIVALFAAAFDVTVLDRSQRRFLRTAAKLGEAFDCRVLRMDWNAFVAGRTASYETLSEASSAWHRRRGKSPLLNWYPPVVGKAPMHLARIICQRTNLWYDAELRRRYGKAVLLGAFMLLFLLFIFALARGLTMELFISTVLAPAGPILIWAVREYYRQADTAEAQETLRADAETLWEKASTGACTPEACSAQSREFQNAIYNRRVASPLILPGIYKRMRPWLEEQMNRGAESYLAELGIK